MAYSTSYLSMLSLSAAHLDSSYRCMGSDVQSFKSVSSQSLAHLPPCCPESSWTQRIASHAKTEAEPRAKDVTPPMNGLDRVTMTGPAPSSSADHLTWLAEAAARGQIPTVNPSLSSPKSTLHSSSGSLFRPPADTLYQFSTAGSTPTTLPLFYSQQARSGYGGFYAPSQYSPPGRTYTHQNAPTSPGLISPQQFFRLDQSYPPPMDSLPHAGRTPFLNVQQSSQQSLHKPSGRTHYEAFDAKTWGDVDKLQGMSPYTGSPKKSSPDGSTDGKNYKMPSGREGSMKHRILKPPNITIVEPPASALGRAPLSAPPLRNSSPYQEIPSPKYIKLTTASRPSVPSYVPSAAAGSSAQLQQHQYPAHFKKGSIIQLANNTLRRVEDLSTEDFLQSAQLSPDLRIDTSVVVRIQEHLDNKSAILGFSVGQNQVQVSVDTPLEHPFFVFNRGWSSCCPQRSQELYGLTCDKLQIGDICISLTHKASGPPTNPLTLMPPAKKVTETKPHKVASEPLPSTGTAPAPQQRKRRCSAPAIVNLDVLTPRQ